MKKQLYISLLILTIINRVTCDYWNKKTFL